MKNILVIHTGGTISMKEDQQTKTVSLSKENPLAPTNTILPEDAYITTLLPFNLPSAHISPEKMLELHTLINEQVTNHPIDGIVITHGTDTLEETAYFLDLIYNHSIPLVVTGAMRSSNEISADGLHNYISAIRVAMTNEAKNKGVLVVINDEIHLATFVTKTHTSNLATFKSTDTGPIGIVTKEQIIFFFEAKKKEIYTISTINKRVALIKAYAGMESDLLEVIPRLDYDGVVIEGLGQGNVSPGTLEGIKALRSNHFPVVLTSRCQNGIPAPNYDYHGGGKGLEQLGVIFADGVNGQKARLHLLVALCAGTPLNEMFLK